MCLCSTSKGWGRYLPRAPESELKSIHRILKWGLIAKSLSLSVTHWLQRYSECLIDNKSEKINSTCSPLFKKSIFFQFSYLQGIMYTCFREKPIFVKLSIRRKHY